MATIVVFRRPFARRTWLLTYTDADLRLVRAGVDGGRSTARELGLVSADEGQAADAYLFVLTREPPAPPTAATRVPGVSVLGGALAASHADRWWPC